jgi:hypothetical protein
MAKIYRLMAMKASPTLALIREERSRKQPNTGAAMPTIALEHAALRLPRAGFARLTGAPGMSIRCRSGLLWVTAENDRTDYFLGPGESMEIRSAGCVVIEAERDSELQLLWASRKSRGQRAAMSFRAGTFGFGADRNEPAGSRPETLLSRILA